MTNLKDAYQDIVMDDLTNEVPILAFSQPDIIVKNIVVSYDLAEKLSQLDMPKFSIYYYNTHYRKDGRVTRTINEFCNNGISAYTFGELWLIATGNSVFNGFEFDYIREYSFGHDLLGRRPVDALAQQMIAFWDGVTVVHQPRTYKSKARRNDKQTA